MILDQWKKLCTEDTKVIDENQDMPDLIIIDGEKVNLAQQ